MIKVNKCEADYPKDGDRNALRNVGLSRLLRLGGGFGCLILVCHRDRLLCSFITGICVQPTVQVSAVSDSIAWARVVRDTSPTSTPPSFNTGIE